MADVNDIWNSGKGKLPEDKLMAYLEGKLSPEEQHEVEAWLAQEGLESDAIEGLKELPAQDSKLITNKLNSRLSDKLKGKHGRRRRKTGNQWAWLAIAIVLLLCIMSYVLIKVSADKVKAAQEIPLSPRVNSEQDSLIKFTPRFSFDDYKVETYTGTHHPVRLTTKLAKMFKTRITETYKEQGVNFAGHYCLVKWGCGSGCSMSAIVDVRTGKVYEGPDGQFTYKFQPDSRLLILNSPDGDDMYSPKPGYYRNIESFMPPEMWLWEDEQKQFKQLQ